MLQKELYLFFIIQKGSPGPHHVGIWYSLPLFARLTLVATVLQSPFCHLMTYEN